MHATLSPPAHRARELGLSLIELVMFIVVLGLALTAVLKAFTQATAASVDPQWRRQALSIAESLMEEVQLMPFSFCDADDPNVETAQAVGDCASLPEAIGHEAGETRYAAPQFDKASVGEATVTADALRITVSVTGPDGSTLTLDGYRSRHAPHAAL